MTALNDAERAAMRRDAEGGAKRSTPLHVERTALERTGRSPAWLPSRRFFAAVIAIDSPSQPRPAVIHRTSISALAAISRKYLSDWRRIGIFNCRCDGLYRNVSSSVVAFSSRKPAPQVLPGTEERRRNTGLYVCPLAPLQITLCV